MRLRTATVPIAGLALALVAPAAPALAHGDALDKVVFRTVVEPQTEGGTAKNMQFVANVPYGITPGATRGMAGTDIEFARIGGRDYAFGGTYFNGLQIIDITDPTAPAKVAVYDCAILQGDVQVFPQGDRVLAAYTADSALDAFGEASRCAQDNGVPRGKLGTFLLDVTDPANPFSVVRRGAGGLAQHHGAPERPVPVQQQLRPAGAHPGRPGDDHQRLAEDRHLDISTPETPVRLAPLRLQYVPLSLGSQSHDVTFSADGTRAYSAALSQTLVIDTVDPAEPRIISQILDPSVQVSHGADPITLKRADGSARELLLISDEQAGAAAGTNCPGGGVHVYDITGELERAPRKMGVWFIGETGPSIGTCTAHVFRMHGDQGLFTIAWYDQGVRVVDVAGLADVPVPAVLFVVSGDGQGIREIGAYRFADHNTWSFKTNRIGTDGSFFGFGNDLGRGLDVYRFDGTALGRTVPALEPVELKPAAGSAPAPVKGNRGGGKGKGPKNAEAVPVLSQGGGSGPAAGALAGLAALVVLSGLAAARRRGDGGLWLA